MGQNYQTTSPLQAKIHYVNSELSRLDVDAKKKEAKIKIIQGRRRKTLTENQDTIA